LSIDDVLKRHSQGSSVRALRLRFEFRTVTRVTV
jgi:hypothetical protein